MFGCADSRFAESRFSRQGIRLVTFCIVQKVTKKHAPTNKKLPVASFCASETAETGRIANGREQGDHVSRRRRSPATSIQSSVGNSFGDTSDGTCRTRFFAQNGDEKALNRCEVQALQRKELERSSKEWPYSLADSRLWLGKKSGGGQKRTAFSAYEKPIDKEKLFLCTAKLQFSTAAKLTEVSKFCRKTLL